MDKRVVVCPSCKKKMKIGNKAAKYRCPNCKEIVVITNLKLFILKIEGFFKGIIQTAIDMKNSIKYKYNNTKATYKYMSQLKKNMKNDPNWSNYHKEQREMKQAEKPNKFKEFFKRK